MSSTNKTTNYQLSQFVGTDKPAWLTDVNTDMQKIDTAIKGVSDVADGANTKANNARTDIGDKANLTTTNKVNLVGAINEVKTDAGASQGTANDAYALANANEQRIDAVEGEIAKGYGSLIKSASGTLSSTNSVLTTATVKKDHLYVYTANGNNIGQATSVFYAKYVNGDQVGLTDLSMSMNNNVASSNAFIMFKASSDGVIELRGWVISGTGDTSYQLQLWDMQGGEPAQ